MSTTITKPIGAPKSGEIELAPVLGAQFQLSWPAALLVGWFALLFLLSSHTPLAVDANTWGQANSGQRIFHNGSLSNEIAHVPLAKGMAKLPTSWLFDAFSACIGSWFGVRGMCVATTIISSLAIWLWSWQFFRTSRNTLLTLISAVVLGVVGSSFFSAFHSRVFDGLLFGLLFVVVWPVAITQAGDEELGAKHFLSCFALFVVWANISTTFVVGVVALLAIAIGKCISQFNAQGWRGLIAVKVSRWVWLLQLSVMATLLTPHGLGLWTHLLTNELDGVIKGITAGRGLYAPSMQGIVTLLLVGFVIWKLARQQTAAANTPAGSRSFAVETVMLIAMGFCLLTDVSHFYGFVATCLLLLASLAPASNTGSTSEPTESQPFRFAGTLFALLFVWCGFALSPLSIPFLGGTLRPEERLHDRGAPWSILNHLHQQVESRAPFVFAPAYWSDWLMFSGPQELEYFANRDFELLPRRVQADYQRVFRGENGWDRILDRYAVTTLVLDREAQARLSASAKRNASWRLMVETPSILMFERKSFDRSGS